MKRGDGRERGGKGEEERIYRVGEGRRGKGRGGEGRGGEERRGEGRKR